MKANNKVGILTYHNAINYGAILQNYALNKYINDLNIECETINYHSKKIDSSYKLIKFKSIKQFVSSLVGIKNNFIKKNRFNLFMKKYIKLSKIKYNALNIRETNSIYNVFITGSDQVWNLDLNEDKNYFLNFVDDNNSMNSYAASFGNINVINKNKNFLKLILSKYNNISLREVCAVNQLYNQLNMKASSVLDPTFLLIESDWNCVCKKRQIKNKYILLYVLHEDEVYCVAERLSKLTGLEVYVISQSYHKKIKSKYIRTAGPSEFLSLIKNSEYVVTDSFHGTAFSIIFKKNLKVVLKNKSKHLNDRLTSILNLFKLDDCIVNKSSSDSLLLCNTNYEKSKKIIDKEIMNSKNFLKNIIGR